MFTTDFIRGEAEALGYYCDDEDVLAQIAKQATEFVWEDEFINRQIMEIVDNVIFNANLPEQ